MTVRVVTDAAAALGAQEAADLGVTIVDLHVLRDGDEVSTSGATPDELAEVYARALADSGGDGVVAVHLSGALSVTVGSARRAAARLAASVVNAESVPGESGSGESDEADAGDAEDAAESGADGADADEGGVTGPVRVVDTLGAGMAQGTVVLEAARLAADGGDLDTVIARAHEVMSASRVWVYLDSLDALWRGGRVGAASALLSAALAIKPILTLRDGRLYPVIKTRTAGRAMEKLVDLVETYCEGADSRIHIHAHEAEERSTDLLERFERIPGAVVSRVELPEVLAVHLGPGAVAVSATLFED